MDDLQLNCIVISADMKEPVTRAAPKVFPCAEGCSEATTTLVMRN